MRGLFSGAVSALRSGRIDASTWESLEEALIRADVGVDHDRRAARRPAGARCRPRRSAAATTCWRPSARPSASCSTTRVSRTCASTAAPGAPDVWLIVGVNGVGKTTTIGKLARRQSAAGRSVLLAAGDTFRAAAADQLAMWAERTGTEIVRGAEGGDPSAVVFDAVQRAAARGNDLVLADTAGRLHTKVNLVEELKKIRRVADRDPGNVTEVLLVLDATTGQNGAGPGSPVRRRGGRDRDRAHQARRHGQGRHRHRRRSASSAVPVKLVGLGEGPDDLVDFDPDEFVDALLASD